MKNLACIASIVVLMSSAMAADTVYRCGAASSPVYSKEPCAGGRAVQVSDPRSAAQKAESEAAARMQAKTADRMEKERLAKEAAWAKANKPPAAAKPPRPKASAPKSKAKHKKDEEEKLPVYVPLRPIPKKGS